MAALICGSLAFDTIMTFEGRFAEQILPDQLHILNVSFLVPSLRRDFGGCAGNIAYSLKLLGGDPVPMAMLGSDGAGYQERLRSLAIDTRHVGQVDDLYTAQAMIMTDRDNNQITAFHPGAMMQAHRSRIVAEPDVRLAIIAPDGRDAMLQHAAQLVEAGIPFVFDPGQGLPMFNGQELAQFIEQATWITVNDYEGRMLCERTGWSLQDISRKVRGLVVTLGAEGCDVWENGERTNVPVAAPAEVVDPTGCGDAWRGALLFGLERDWPLVRCAALGNRMGALKIAQRGPQNYVLDFHPE
ncbi:carbohydrate kinase family protein [Acidovorax sp. SUPP950]|uniref:carbohydrate kinase family protein n=1 Tax=unclassified Acidovorax TaxID=2684926 RepID=UPI0023BE3D92|nr:MULTISPECIES: carbohydrate kinase family protein [Comamonadaceae]WOI45763.1 carbohydrate kinase family protein [Paracidovorax avenae]GKS74909.1 carbohydrate kinase family protein [Acidovorax sp. SUPP950]GKS87828.1 carbohydrate kinase family protein [Acidovorax sp. SUPP2539]GKS99126.1 carbohydrate kinase family protein [Acidovorax sp. SUPP3434]